MSGPEQNDQDFEDFGQLPQDAFAAESLGSSGELGGDFGEVTTDASAAVETSPARPETGPPAALREKVALRDQIKRADIFIIMLAISLAAILIAVICLFSELASYRFDVRAKSAAVEVVAPRAFAISSDLGQGPGTQV